MIRRGLSDEVISRLRYLDDCGALDSDDDLSVLVRSAVRQADELDRFRVAEALTKRLQLFINSELYQEVYSKKSSESPVQTVKPGPIQPGSPQFEQLRALLGAADRQMEVSSANAFRG